MAMFIYLYCVYICFSAIVGKSKIVTFWSFITKKACQPCTKMWQASSVGGWPWARLQFPMLKYVVISVVSTWPWHPPSFYAKRWLGPNYVLRLHLLHHGGWMGERLSGDPQRGDYSDDMWWLTREIAVGEGDRTGGGKDGGKMRIRFGDTQ